MTTDPILFVADATHQHTPGMQRAFDLARRTATAVHVLLVAHDPLLDGALSLVNPEVYQLARRQFVADRQAWLDSLISAWTRDGLRATGEVLWSDDAHAVIVERCLDMHPVMVIKDAARQGRVRKLLLGGLDWKLIRYCPAPLMLVRAGSAAMPKTILAAVEASTGPEHPLDAKIASFALSLGGHTGADVHVAHVFPYGRTSYTSLDKLYDAVRDNDARSFKEFADRHSFPSRFRHWSVGNPAAELAKLAKSQAVDLIVMGSAYRSSFDRMFLGSTASAAVGDLPCDLLLIKPEGFAAESAAARRASPTLAPLYA